MQCSDFPTPVPPHFVAFAWRYHPSRLSSFLLADPTPVRRPGGFGWAPPKASCLEMETTGSPTFLGNPGVHMPCSKTPVGSSTPDRLRRLDTAFRTECGRRRLPQIALFRGSITRPMHSLSTLRSAGRPNTTQDSLPAAGQLCRTGLNTCRVPTNGFMRIGHGPMSQSSFPKLRGAPAFGAARLGQAA